ncbi:MAG TPA: hypothetical protein VEV37_02485 [Bryobacteraceae bacterium]|nr:hypothetical protein [Bryobacteraceae bacterium]
MRTSSLPFQNVNGSIVRRLTGSGNAGSVFDIWLVLGGRRQADRQSPDSNLTIQGFLFAAYSFSLQKIVDVKVNLLNTAVDRKRVAQLEIPHTIHDLQTLLVMLALAGMVTSFLVSSVYWRLVWPSMK